MNMSKAIRKAIKESKETRYAIALNSGVDHAVIRRFMNEERDIKLTTAEKLADYLGLELVQAKSKKKK